MGLRLALDVSECFFRCHVAATALGPSNSKQALFGMSFVRLVRDLDFRNLQVFWVQRHCTMAVLRSEVRGEQRARHRKCARKSAAFHYTTKGTVHGTGCVALQYIKADFVVASFALKKALSDEDRNQMQDCTSKAVETPDGVFVTTKVMYFNSCGSEGIPNTRMVWHAGSSKTTPSVSFETTKAVCANEELLVPYLLK